MTNNKIKIKQIFSNEADNRLKDIGDFAFAVDKNDFIIKKDINEFYYFKQSDYLISQLQNLQQDYRTNLHLLIQEVINVVKEPSNNIQKYEEIFGTESQYSQIVDALNWFEFYGEEDD